MNKPSVVGFISVSELFYLEQHEEELKMGIWIQTYKRLFTHYFEFFYNTYTCHTLSVKLLLYCSQSNISN